MRRVVFPSPTDDEEYIAGVLHQMVQSWALEQEPGKIFTIYSWDIAGRLGLYCFVGVNIIEDEVE